MLYITFVQPPKISTNTEGASTVNCSVRVVSDLADRALSSSSSIVFSVFSYFGQSKEEPLHVSQPWSSKYPGDICKLKFAQREASSDRKRFYIIGKIVGTNAESSEKLFDGGGAFGVPCLLPVYSADARPGGGPPMELVQQRQLCGRTGACSLKLFEEVRDGSLARHAWDGGLALAAWIDQRMQPGISPDFADSVNPRLRVLELGCGIGTVGIHIAQLVANTSVYLTDVADAREIVELNIKEAQPAKGSEIKFFELDWNEPHYPEVVMKEQVDLVLISECFYNTDAAQALFKTLDGIFSIPGQEKNRAAPILIGWKERNPDERQFKAMMDEKYDLTLHEKVTLPDADPDFEPEEANILVYRHKDRPLASQEVNYAPPQLETVRLKDLWKELPHDRSKRRRSSDNRHEQAKRAESSKKRTRGSVD